MKKTQFRKLTACLIVALTLIIPFTLKAQSVDAANAQVVAIAKTKLGAKYVYGAGHSMSAIANKNQNQFDCSSFVCWSYYQAGINIGNRTSSSLASVGVKVEYNDLQIGDILLFPGHAGIYVGNNQMIHAPNSRSVVKIQSLSGYYRNRFIQGRRVASSTTATNTNNTVNVNSASTNTYRLNANMMVRSGAGTNYRAVGSLRAGTTVTVTSISNGKWARINYNGTYRYMSLAYSSRV